METGSFVSGYKTVSGISEAEVIEKKSRFISHLSHVECEEEAVDFIDRIRQENQQARHNVYAYLLRAGRTRYSDDGEPAQTSGLPTFETIEHAGLCDVVIVTTRYFGGILLGTGGLVRAYTQAAKEAITRARIVQIISCIDFEFTLPYDLNSQVQKAISESGATVLLCEYTDKVKIRVRVREDAASDFERLLTETMRGRIGLQKTPPHLAEL